MNSIPSLAPEVLFYIGSFGVTNTLFWSFFISIFLMVFILLIRFRMKEVPGRWQNFLEVLIGGSIDFITTITGDEKKTRRIFPFIFTLFLFISVCNLFAFIPAAALAVKDAETSGVPVFRSVMSDYGMVLILTIIAIITVQVVTIAVNGPLGYIGKFINVRKLFSARSVGDFAFGLLDVFLGVMDLVGEIAKVFSLSFRLFGNIFAGEVLTIVMLSLAPFFMPLPFMFLGLLSAVIQAFVFSVLTLVFIDMASEPVVND